MRDGLDFGRNTKNHQATPDLVTTVLAKRSFCEWQISYCVRIACNRSVFCGKDLDAAARNNPSSLRVASARRWLRRNLDLAFRAQARNLLGHVQRATLCQTVPSGQGVLSFANIW